MSSSEQDASDSEKSCQELDRSTNSTKYVNRKGTNSSSESDDSDDEPETTTPVGRKHNTVGAHDISEEESENSAASDQNAVSPGRRRSSSSDDGSSIQSNLKNEKTVTAKSSSDSESQDSESVSSMSSEKHKSKLGNSINESDSSDEDSSNQLIQCKSNIDTESDSEDAREKCSSNLRKSESNDSDSDREIKEEQGKSSDDEGLPDNMVLAHPTPGNIFSFSDENLINYSSGIINLEKLSNNNDFWLVHCPKTISDKELVGAEIDFETNSRLKINGRKLQTTCYPEKGVVACVLPSDQYKQYFVVGLPVKGSVLFEESVKLPKPATLEINSKSDVKFPSQLRERHPLFGADYKERLRKISDSKHLWKTSKKKVALSRGNESIVASVDLLQPKMRKVRKDKKKSTSSNEVNETNSPKEQSRKEHKKSYSEKGDMINSESTLKHSKKRRRDMTDSDSGVNDSQETFKVKKRKVTQEDLQLDHTMLSKKTSKTSSPDHSFLRILQNIKEEVRSSTELSFDEETPVKKKRKSKNYA